MKRTYLTGCTWCKATGIVSATHSMNTTEECPVCNGSGTVLVTEED